ncbi:hypothetical protein D3C76_1209810 [compost metagenome]
MTFGVVDRALDRALQGAPNAFEHTIEGRQLANRLIVDGHGHLTEHAEHRALTYRVGLALEAVVQGNAADGRLEQRELIGHERIAVGEVFKIAEILVMLTAISELE